MTTTLMFQVVSIMVVYACGMTTLSKSNSMWCILLSLAVGSFSIFAMLRVVGNAVTSAGVCG
ncbi:MAG: hypothetical protein ACRCWQ_02705 [Bacilli bacterium]